MRQRRRLVLVACAVGATLSALGCTSEDCATLFLLPDELCEEEHDESPGEPTPPTHLVGEAFLGGTSEWPGETVVAALLDAETGRELAREEAVVNDTSVQLIVRVPIDPAVERVGLQLFVDLDRDGDCDADQPSWYRTPVNPSHRVSLTRVHIDPWSGCGP